MKQPVQRTPLWPASWLLAVDKSRGSKFVEVQRVWEIYDDRLQFMFGQDALLLHESSDAGDVFQAWLVWSGAAETALADAYRFSGGPAPNRGLVLGRGRARFRVVRLGGHKVRKVRGSAADAHDAADVLLHRDSSIAPLLDMRRRFKAVMDVLDSMISHMVTLARSVEQRNRILSVGALYPVTLDDFHAVQGVGLGDFRRVVGDIHHGLSDFIELLFTVGRRIPLYTLTSGLGLTWFLLLLFCSVILSSLLVVLGFWLIRAGLMKNSDRPGFPSFAALGKVTPALRNSMKKSRGGYLCCLRLLCPG